MYPERSPIDGIDSMLVSLDGGTVFHVSPAYLGGPNSPYPEYIRLRWIIRPMSPLRDGDTVSEHVGPPIQLDRSPAAVRELVSDWWATKKDLGQGDGDGRR